MLNQKELPEPKDHLLLPKAHVHLFAQISLLVIGLLLLVGGLVLYFLGYGEFQGTAAVDLETVNGAIELFYFLAAGLLMGSGAACLIAWSLWKYAKKFRVRFLISILVATFAICAGLVSIITQEISNPINYTFYFFSLSAGMLVGLLSIFYFFQGVAKHMFATSHK